MRSVVRAHKCALTANGYTWSQAAALRDLAKGISATSDRIVNDLSLRQNLLATLQIEADRFNPDTKMIAQNGRERLMKQQFLAHFAHDSSKVLFRLGRNHLHRGYDARGISTLGNFVVEFAIARGRMAFNVGAFGTGGTIRLGGTFDADERKDELAFARLAKTAKYAATVFDLRPIRQLLHRIPPEQRTPLEVNLIYWADSYDAVIAYRHVTPLSS